MKITYFQLAPHLAQVLAKVYLISGEQGYLKQEAGQLIRKAAHKAGFLERIRLTLDAKSTEDELYQSLYAASLLAEKRIIELDFNEGFPNKSIAERLQTYAKNPLPENLLVLLVGKIDTRISKTLWYKTLDSLGITVTIWPITPAQLPQWIIARAKKYKLMCDQKAAQLLSEYVEGNVAAAAQAIEKIYLLKPDNAVIDEETVKLILTDESHFSIFDLTDQATSGNTAQALRILHHLKKEGTEPALILWSLTREIRLLIELAQKIKTNHDMDALFQTHRIYARRQSAMRHFLSAQKKDTSWQYLIHAAKIDRMIKGADKGNVWESLELFCLRLSQHA